MAKSSANIVFDAPDHVAADKFLTTPVNPFVTLSIWQGDHLCSITMSEEAWVKACARVLLLIREKETDGQRQSGT